MVFGMRKHRRRQRRRSDVDRRPRKELLQTDRRIELASLRRIISAHVCLDLRLCLTFGLLPIILRLLILSHAFCFSKNTLFFST